MIRLALATLVASLLAATPAAAATVYRDGDNGLEVRVDGRAALVTFYVTKCGSSTEEGRIRHGRFTRTTVMQCGVAPPTGGAPPTKRVRLELRITRREVRGTVGGQAVRARRGVRPFDAAQRCAHRGITVAENDVARVKYQDDATIACRRRDGRATTLARTTSDSDGYYFSGTAATLVQLAGSRVTYVRTPVDSAASKFGQATGPRFMPSVLASDLETGAATSVSAELPFVAALVARLDGRMAWAGPTSQSPGSDVAVKTVQDGRVVTLDQGRIDPASLRVEGDGFAWNKTG